VKFGLKAKRERYKKPFPKVKAVVWKRRKSRRMKTDWERKTHQARGAKRGGQEASTQKEKN